ncbi:MAG: sodium:proton antiporter [Thermoleophilia bacterium]|nr:sodium:proton antiporter [Thermoleophilia bacterium]
MSLASIDLFHVLAALAVLLTVAHAGGLLAQRIGIPPMVGELVGGLLLGATVLDRIWPDAKQWLFPSVPADGPIPAVIPVLAFCSQLGLLLLMFIGGMGMRRLVRRSDLRPVAWISTLGVAVPVVFGLVVLQFADFAEYQGPAKALTSLHIVLLAALAVTSIPVITRIFIDLGLMETRLARIVLSVAVLEDVLLYVGISVAVGLASGKASEDASIPAFIGLDPSGPAYIAWHVCASFALLIGVTLGVRHVAIQRKLKPGPSSASRNPIARRSPLGWTVALLFCVTLVAMLLGLAPIFGALVAGIAASYELREEFVAARRAIENFAMATFVPVYFALVGVGLDLIDGFDWKFTVGLLLVGTLVKYSSSLLGARLAGETPAMARALAVSVNARGGPGIVLATTALAAGIVDQRTYSALIILAIATSVIAGVWLATMLRRDEETAAMLRSSNATPPRTKVVA